MLCHCMRCGCVVFLWPGSGSGWLVAFTTAVPGRLPVGHDAAVSSVQRTEPVDARSVVTLPLCLPHLQILFLCPPTTVTGVGASGEAAASHVRIHRGSQSGSPVSANTEVSMNNSNHRVWTPHIYSNVAILIYIIRPILISIPIMGITYPRSGIKSLSLKENIIILYFIWH